MVRVLGPILYAEDSTPANWCFRVHLTTPAGTLAPPAPSALRFDPSDVRVAPAVLAADLTEYGLGKTWSWKVVVPRRDVERRVSYTLSHGGRSWEVDHVAVPARGLLPRLAVTSCAGFSDPKEEKKVAPQKPYELWERMLNLHRASKVEPKPENPSGFHLLIGGGDQLYCDSVEITVGGGTKTVLKLVAERPDWSPDALERAANRAYFARYADRFAEPAMREILCRVPVSMTWDDHEIFDGCGSYSSDVQNHPTPQALFRAARRAFVAFELGGDPALLSAPAVYAPDSAASDATKPHFLQWRCFEADGADLDVVLLDLRSGRTPTRVLSEAQWFALERVLRAVESRTSGRARHVLLVSSIPLVHARHPVLIEIIDALPSKPEITDDLLDQWEHSLHVDEQLRLVDRLFKAQSKGCRVTLLSGDVHSGAALLVVSSRKEHRRGSARIPLLQLTTSAVVHPIPPIANTILERFVAADGDELAEGIHTEFAIALADVKSIFEPNYTSISFGKRTTNDLSYVGRAHFQRKVLGTLGPVQFKP